MLDCAWRGGNRDADSSRRTGINVTRYRAALIGFRLWIALGYGSGRAGTMPAAEWVAVRGIMLGFCRAYLSRAQRVPARLNGMRKSD